MWYVLAIALACNEPEEVPVEEPGPSAEERVASLRAEMGLAHDAWANGRRRDAVAIVHAAYARDFEPLEPALREQDPVGTLQLEYGFGRLAARHGRAGKAQDLQGESQALIASVETAVAALPSEEVK